jgi:hypothetical protein
MRNIALWSGLLLSSSSCIGRRVARVDPEQTKVEVKDLPANPEKDVDILFLIDNSGSMEAEQASLRANFPKFMQVLETLEGGAPNMHIGVATPNMGQHATDGVGTAQIGGCSSRGDDGALRTTPTVSGRFIIDEQSGTGRNRNYSGALSDAFSALADVGFAGCGIEQHLSAVQRALENKAMNAGFLRDEAKLAIIVIADEDDCSLAHNNLFESGVSGPIINFRCTKTGITCTDNPDLSKPGLRTDCKPAATSQYLESVDRYVEAIKGMKRNWHDNVIVAGIVGDSEPFKIELNSDNQPILGPSCTYNGNDGAVPALRTASFLDKFQQKVQRTICNADLSQAMVDIGALLKRSFGDPCWEGVVADMDPDTAGIQPECSVLDVQVLPDGTRKELEAVPACGGGDIPCWKLVEDAAQCFYTEQHLKLVVDRGGVIPPDDVHVQASCTTLAPDGPFM